MGYNGFIHEPGPKIGAWQLKTVRKPNFWPNLVGFHGFYGFYANKL